MGVPRSLGVRDTSLLREGEEFVEPRMVGFVFEHEDELLSRNSLKSFDHDCIGRGGGSEGEGVEK